MRAQLYKFGYEIEGEFSSQLLSRLEKLGVMKTDGSIHQCGNHNSYLELGEFNSKPAQLNPHGRVKTKKLFEMLQREYKREKLHFNDSMGFHVHLSFKPTYPVELFSHEFVKYFLGKLKREYPDVWEDRATNKFCRVNIKEADITYGHDRYKAINLYPSFVTHKTIEFRIFPADTPEKMYEYLFFVIKSTKAFLRSDFSMKKELNLRENPQEVDINYEAIAPNRIEPVVEYNY